MQDGSVRAIEESVRQLLARKNRIVLAVSGGLDSSVLLDAFARLRTPDHRIIVASVDHGTGAAATESTAQAVAAAARHGLSAVTERLSGVRASEAHWRVARWSFLRTVAQREEAAIATAHSLDDHVETVVMRVLRGAAARGLSGLLAPSDVERPLLSHTRAQTLDYATRRRLAWVDDPSNASRAFLRNRIRLDFLPAIRQVCPGFERDMLRLSEWAATVRRSVDALAGSFLIPSRDGVLLTLDADALGRLTPDEAALVLPSLLERAGIRLDRRGLSRLVNLRSAAHGSRGQLSGGFEAVRGRTGILIHRPPVAVSGPVPLRATGETAYPGFRFHAEPAASIGSGALAGEVDAWRIHFPRSTQLVVRQWYPGDRLTNDMTGGRRRVKRYFADAGIVGPLRAGWPVVVRGEDVIWIPGVRATPMQVHREEAMIEYRCERVRG